MKHEGINLKGSWEAYMGRSRRRKREMKKIVIQTSKIKLKEKSL